jgi:tRNA threonylcarbamoyl adenosine modification protein YeaZ
MLILAINTATARTAVALMDVNKNAAPKILYGRIWDSRHDEAMKLIPQIKHVLKKGKPEKIFVVEGPGAFTSLRIGITIANTLAHFLDVPIVSCSTFEFLRTSVSENLRKNTMLILRAGGDYVAALAPNQKKEKRIAKSELGNFVKRLKNIKFAVTDMSDEEKKKTSLPDAIKWLPQGKMYAFEKTVNILVQKNPRGKKQVAPRYLMSPKITQSKKEVFV